MTSFEKRVSFFEPLVILGFWLIFFALPLVFTKLEDGFDWKPIFEIWKNHLSLLIVFLIHRFVLMPFLLFRGKKVAYYSITFAILTMGTFLVYFFDEGRGQHPMSIDTERPEGRPFDHQDGIWRQPPEHMPPPPNQGSQGPIPYYANFLVFAILLVGFDSSLQISIRWMGLEKEKIKLQKESVENQLAFLRTQISPHFFMNTLNNIHALVDLDSEEAKHSILKLSYLMRHLLYDSEEKQIPLVKEVEFIQSYIELMRLRFSDRVGIQVEIPEVIPKKIVPPLLFTSLLENAFKHGVSYNRPSFIKIAITFTESHLNFRVENSNHSKKGDTSSGIGIENTKKRLELLYKKDYELEIFDNNEVYVTNLSIPI